MIKIRSFLIDYKLRNGVNAYREFQIMEQLGLKYDDKTVMLCARSLMPGNASMLCVHEILKDNMTMAELEAAVKKGNAESDIRILYVNVEEAIREAQAYMKSVSKRCSEGA